MSADDSVSATKSEPFGFEIDWPHTTTYSWGDHVEKYWRVKLPHQCGGWEITWKATKEEAIAEMEQFIAEAQAALADLRAKEI
jgi:hypothetical protein